MLVGKRLTTQKRGHGGLTFQANSHRYLARVRYRKLEEKQEILEGRVIDLLHDPGRNTPVAQVAFADGVKDYVLVPEGLSVGTKIEMGPKAKLAPGNALPLSLIPEGTPVFNIEIRPGDGGKLVRSSGIYGTVTSRDMEKTIVQLPSKAFKTLNPRCLATVGVTAGGGRKDKPICKAGSRWYAKRARGKQYPRSHPVNMNAVDHKFGGSTIGGPKTRSRDAPPGAKFGSFGARRTGRKKK